MAKKTFLDNNPALDFISKESIEAVEGKEADPEEKTPDGYKVNPMYIEKKSKRIQLIMQPSLYERIKEASSAEGVSFNEFCHRALKEATKER